MTGNLQTAGNPARTLRLHCSNRPRPLSQTQIQTLKLTLTLLVGFALSNALPAAAAQILDPVLLSTSAPRGLDGQATPQASTEAASPAPFQDPFACAGDLKYEQFPDNVAAIPAQDQCGQILVQAADDFPGMGDRVIGFSWWGVYQHPPGNPPPPPEFVRIEIFTTTGQGQPDQLVYATEVNNYTETREVPQNDVTLASYCVNLPDDFYADPGMTFSVSITAGLCQPEQWAWLTAEGNGTDAWVRVPGEFDVWTPIPEVYGISTDLAFSVLCMPTRVDITKSIPGWQPGYGNVTTYTSRIYWYDPRSDECLSPGPAKIIKFDLAPISRELGYCLNRGIRPSLDLHLNDPANSGMVLLASTFETCDLVGDHDHWTSVETSSCVSEASVTVVSEDYGAYGSIEASASGCFGPDPSPILPREVGAGPTCAPGPARTKIPRDENGNDIEDTFAGDFSSGNSLATWDAETAPNPLAGSNGDGFTRYEEWRGVSIMGTHTRLLTTLRDLFVYRENAAWGATDAATIATIHWITANEMNGALHDPATGTVNAAVGPRIVNFNRTSHTLHDQHGLWRRVSPGNGNRGNWGIALSNTGTTTGPIGPPRVNGRIEIYAGNITAACANVVGRQFRRRTRGQSVVAQFASDAVAKANDITNWIIGHEMGHAVNLHHHARARRWVGHGPRSAADGWFNVNTTRPISTRTVWNSMAGERSCSMAYGFHEIWNSVSLARRTRPLRWTSTASWWGFLPDHAGFGTTCTVPGQPSCRLNVKIDDAD